MRYKWQRVRAHMALHTCNTPSLVPTWRLCEPMRGPRLLACTASMSPCPCASTLLCLRAAVPLVGATSHHMLLASSLKPGPVVEVLQYLGTCIAKFAIMLMSIDSTSASHPLETRSLDRPDRKPHLLGIVPKWHCNSRNNCNLMQIVIGRVGFLSRST